MSATTNIPHEAVEIGVDSLETSAGRLICAIKPTWATKQLTFKKLGTDDSIIQYAIFPNNDEDERHGVVIKLYPTNSDVYIDHQEQIRLINKLVHHEIAPRVLLTFTNGYYANYVLGKSLDIKEGHTHLLIARKVAEFHSISSKFDGSLQFLDKLEHFIDLFTKKNVTLDHRLAQIKKEYEESVNNDTSLLTSIKYAIGLSITSTLTLDQLESQLKDTSWAELSTEIHFIRTIFQNNWTTYGVPTVLCLNNMNIQNFLFDSKNEAMSIIDFNHCSYNYYLIDIVSYFLELAKDDYETKYPGRRTQKTILAEYLKHSSLNTTKIVYDQELEHLCDLCGLLIAPVHLYWALWAFLQALLTKPTSTFDFINYGKTRLAQYQRHKKNFFLPLYHSNK